MISCWNKAFVALFLFILSSCSTTNDTKIRRYENYISSGNNSKAYEVLKTIPDEMRSKDQLLFEYRLLFPEELGRLEIILAHLKNFPLTSLENKEYIIGISYVCHSKSDYECVETKYDEYYEIENKYSENQSNEDSNNDLYYDYLMDTLQFSHPLTTEYLEFIYEETVKKYKYSINDEKFTHLLKSEYYKRLAGVLYDYKEYERALEILDLLILDQPDDPELYMQYIENLYFGNKKVEAKIFADKHYETFHDYSRFKLVYDALIAGK